MPSRFHRTPSAPEQPPHARPRRRALKAAGALALSLAALLLASTAANLILEGAEKAHAAPYGERVQIKEGTINVSRSGHTGPTIVLLSGLGTPAPALDFAPLIRELGGFQTVVVEGFGYGYSGTEARPRTVENITEELHEVISKLAIKTPYTLAGHSIGGFYTLYYANKYPREVSSVIGIDPTVPASKTTTGKTPAATVAPARNDFWAHIPSTTGLVRWATALGYGEPGGEGFTKTEREQMRRLTSWTFGNQAVTDETLRVGENAAKLRDLRYPDSLPVLDFLSQDSMDQNSDWLGAHQRQLATVKHHELVVLKGGHYLHWTQSNVMAHKIRAFLGHGGTK
ncbi:alpha/beta fold hydrolase [Arthrobacter dokdonensis]|uniref:alpha/beta fold hydrolase n=1 Tax=Arthrobacter dokdonellae TaxID=2211210 RepID=UPI000DE5B5BF|nr:alpha/beta hydrolase [Arthrobacter dokdonellae]